jgi:dihydroorotate dehydrogenase electron transfer subunit
MVGDNMYNGIFKIIKNDRVAEGIFEMVIQAEEIAAAASPGQFVHIRVNKGFYPLLRRPVSIHSLDRAVGTVTILYHVMGRGTEEISCLKEGSSLDVMGPLGNGFPIFMDKKCAVVGGGIGTAPLLELARNLNSCDAYLGFRSCTYKLEEFGKACNKVHYSTEDGSSGYKGHITELIEEAISVYDVVYTCGPLKMMERVMEICFNNNVECYVSIEERMGCGIGACLVCACKIKGEQGTWHNMKACKDGPVFNAREVMLNA